MRAFRIARCHPSQTKPPDMDYELHRSSRLCAASGRELRAGEPIYSVLIRQGVRLERLDYAIEAWPGPPENAVGWWKSHIAPPERKKRQAPSEVLLDLMQQLADRPDQADLRYVLALLLVRRRVLRQEESATTDTELTLYCPREDTTHHVLVALPDERRAAEIQDTLGRLLSVDAPPAQAAPSAAVWPPLLLLLLLTGGFGAGCPKMVRQAQIPVPRLLPPAATREQVMAAVNGNAARVQSYYTTTASIGSPMFPSVRASIALERPRNFRLRADTAFTGPEVDLGSNPAEFWFWIRRNQPPALYHCRHDQFESSPARQMFPIEPDWLIEALGVTGFAPEDEHQGPFGAGTGRLEMRTVRQTANGPVHKITILDDSSGNILEQQLYDSQGRLFAKARAGDHRRDAAQQVTLPHHVEIQIPAMQMELKIDIRDIELNSLGENSRNLWTRPSHEGWPDTDLGDPNFRMPEVAQRNYRPPPAAPSPAQPAARPPREGFLKRLLRR